MIQLLEPQCRQRRCFGEGVLIGLDVFRIIAAFIVMLFHSLIHIDCNYGILNSFVSMGVIFMTVFLYYVHEARRLCGSKCNKEVFL